MNKYLKTVAGIMALTSVSTGIHATVSADISSDVNLQMRSPPHEISSENDGQNSNAVVSDNQPQGSTVEILSPSITEAFLEQVRIDSRLQAAEAAYNLSIIVANRKDLALARTLIEESIQLNQSNPNYLALAADIAYLTQDYPKAEEYQVMVLELIKSKPGIDDLQVALILDQLSAINVAQGHYEEANSSLQASLQLREQVLGSSHLLVAMSLNKLALLAVRQERSAVAESLLKRSLDITREVSGPQHANSAVMLANLADFYLSEARLEEAETFYEEAISIWSDSSGDSLRLSIVQNSLGRLYLSQQRFDDARLQFEQVLVLLKQHYKQDHPYVQQAIQNLTDLDAKRDRNVEKDRMYDELVRELSSSLSVRKGVTADITPSSPAPRIMQF